MSKSYYLVNVQRQTTDRQVYIQSFCEAWIESGGKYVNKSKLTKSLFISAILKLLAYCHYSRKKKDKAYVVCSRGAHLLKAALPYCFRGEIVPMLWDCWTSTHNTLTRHLKLLNCRMCFVTSSDAAGILSERLPNVRFVHLPEGVDLNDYKEGRLLKDRDIDVYEMGRRHQYYHKLLKEGNKENAFNHIYNENGKMFLIDSFKDFAGTMSNAKIVICFPRSMTDPINNGTISTLTMRYWEAMLSRCVLIGNCPRELIDLIGYNPVIEADFVNPCAQISDILTHIDDYQERVDHNREVALKHAPWATRIADMRKALIAR